MLTEQPEISLFVTHFIQKVDRCLILDSNKHNIALSVNPLALLLLVLDIVLWDECPIALVFELLVCKCWFEEHLRQPNDLLLIILVILDVVIDSCSFDDGADSELQLSEHEVNLPVALERVDCRLAIEVVDIDFATISCF